MTTWVELLERRARERPHLPLLVFLADGETEAGRMDGPTLRDRALAAAGWLAPFRGERVVLLLPAGLDFLPTFLGALLAGVVPVPAPPPVSAHPARNRQRFASIAADARPAAVVAGADGLAMLDLGLGTSCVGLRVEDCPREPSGACPLAVPSPGEVAYLQYTSGSTGAPRGTRITHGNLAAMARILEEAKGYGPESRSVVWVPPWHDDGLVHGLLQPLQTGFQAVVMPPAAFAARPVRWLAAIARHRATHSGGPDFAYDLCVRKVRDEEAAGLDLSSWGFAYDAAEPIRPATLDAFSARFAPHGFRRESFAPCYGLAEATLSVTVARGGPHVLRVDRRRLEREGRIEPAAGPGAREVCSCGRPVRDTEVEIVRPGSAEPCPPGEVGEIVVSGPAVAAGYTTGSEDTFPAPGRVRTGDLGFLLDGELFVTGRAKDVLVFRGEKRAPHEIEWTVASCHAAIRPGAAAAFSIDRGGAEALAIAVEVRSDLEAGGESGVFDSIREAVLVEHELEVSAIVLLDPGGLPRTSSGKVRRSACRVRWPLPGRATWPAAGDPHVWPSLAEFGVYDATIYHALTHDERRNEAYRIAIRAAVPGRVVLDVGTGRDAILARLCVEAGARRVYAVERLEEPWREARASIARLGLADRIVLVHGDARTVALPEPAEVCVSELVGHVGSMEGAVPILAAVRRLLVPGAPWIPVRSITRIAPVTLPDELLEPTFRELPAWYARRLFEQVGRPFELRVGIRHFPPGGLLAASGVFEDLDFAGEPRESQRHDSLLAISRAGRLDGFLLWLELHTAPGTVIDTLAHDHAWLPVYFPVFDPGLPVRPGDVLELHSESRPSENGLNPDYRVHGRLVRAGGEVVPFDHASPHAAPIRRASRFYRRLLEETAPAAGARPRIFDFEAVRDWVVEWIGRNHPRAACELGLDTPFARLGLDSIASVELAAELGDWLGRTIPPTLVWDHPDVRRLAAAMATPASAPCASR